MKKLTLLSIFVALLLTSCTTNTKQKQEQSQDNKIKAKSISEVMDMAESNIGKEIYLQGLVNHVCSHSGRRCILIDTTGDLSIRVEATGDLKGFNRELSGSMIAVRGTIQEKRLSAEYIDEWEQKVKSKEAEVVEKEHAESDHDDKKADVEEGGKHCSAEMSNIIKMKEWMAKNKKDYYAIYFINGTEYEVLD